jgi:hypothetical protein
MMFESVRLLGRDVKPHKATRNAEFGGRTVLTNSPWEYVALWLQRNNNAGAEAASFYWTQARAFALAAQGLPQESAPLPLYYSYMNAAKALLVSKGKVIQEFHGVTRHRLSTTSSILDLENEGVRILEKGILPMLSKYLNEQEERNTHNLKDLLFNLPCIHRTFCITYSRLSELFIPLTNCRYVFDCLSGKAYLVAHISSDFDYDSYIGFLPDSLKDESQNSHSRVVRSCESAQISSSTLSVDSDIAAIGDLNRKLRPDIQYIGGSTTLWYAKAKARSGDNILCRSPLTISLAAMHRLSELARYSPMQLANLFKGDQNWLLSEFIRMSPQQFIDEIAAEITGHQCMTPNVRPAS